MQFKTRLLVEDLVGISLTSSNSVRQGRAAWSPGQKLTGGVELGVGSFLRFLKISTTETSVAKFWKFKPPSFLRSSPDCERCCFFQGACKGEM